MSLHSNLYVNVCMYTHTHTHIFINIHTFVIDSDPYSIKIKIFFFFRTITKALGTHTHIHTYVCVVRMHAIKIKWRQLPKGVVYCRYISFSGDHDLDRFIPVNYIGVYLSLYGLHFEFNDVRCQRVHNIMGFEFRVKPY